MKNLARKKDTPPELDVLRMFYESYHTEKPNDELPIQFCLAHGIFDVKKATELMKARASAGWAANQEKAMAARQAAFAKKSFGVSTASSSVEPAKKKQKKEPEVKVKAEKKQPTKKASNKKASSSDSSSDEDLPLASIKQEAKTEAAAATSESDADSSS